MATVIDMPYQPDWVDYLSSGIRNIGSFILKRQEEKRREEEEKKRAEAFQEALRRLIKEYGQPTIRANERGGFSYTFNPKKEINQIKAFEDNIKLKVIRGEPLTPQERNYYNAFMAKILIPDIGLEPVSENPPQNQTVLPKKKKDGFFAPLFHPSQWIREGWFKYRKRDQNYDPLGIR